LATLLELSIPESLRANRDPRAIAEATEARAERKQQLGIGSLLVGCRFRLVRVAQSDQAEAQLRNRQEDRPAGR
jgi:hypothetical protein